MNKIYPNDPALPCEKAAEVDPDDLVFGYPPASMRKKGYYGLNIRQELATRFAAAIIASQDPNMLDGRMLAVRAFEFADAFIEENNKQEEQE